MSYEEFKKRIDTARNILVGAVPSPAGQIDQITYALMYKFMNDIDDQSAALGGKRSYFTGDYEKYNWHQLMAPSLGAHERLDLYRQAVQGMAKNENLPPLFREIYQNAFLPFNSASVLTLFLKEIDKFNHGDSDDIGDAYEYLLSITGSQGDVGQFRTPRHIIKFIVEAVNPTKDDKVLDPAVGTAGFLIAAYNHVRAQHDGKDQDGKSNDEKHLTADELAKLHKNYRGFDIDPTMVRTASVNMYLHGFTTPNIINHDSLSSEDYWSDRYDVILANPPFMTPKGGIQPHKKFSITANRAEVLFVDYIASHLKPSGRAGIVVPEGVIFQSGNAYKQLRKNLVENYLYAVVSLPAGVFQPYSGVKTSVLLLDPQLANERDSILFAKVENDGLSLGAQRRAIAGNQFPEALEIVKKFQVGEKVEPTIAHTVSRSDIAESGDYNLSGDRYKDTIERLSSYGLAKIGDIAEVVSGYGFPKDAQGILNEEVPFLKVSDMNLPGNEVIIKSWNNTISRETLRKLKAKSFPKYTIIFPKIGAAIATNKKRILSVASTIDNNVMGLVPGSKILPEYLYYVVCSIDISAWASDSALPSINKSTVEDVKIPLPPIEIQREITVELDSYRKIIDAAQTIVKTYKPSIGIKSEWGSVKVSDLFDKITNAWTPSAKNAADFHFYVGLENIESNTGHLTLSNNPNQPLPSSNKTCFQQGDILYGKLRPNLNKVAYSSIGPSICSTDILVLRPKDKEGTNAELYSYLMRQSSFNDRVLAGISGAQLPRVKPDYFLNLEMPNIPTEVQCELVAELRSEQQLIDASKKLIETFTQKIKSKIAEVWGE